MNAVQRQFIALDRESQNVFLDVDHAPVRDRRTDCAIRHTGRPAAGAAAPKSAAEWSSATGGWAGTHQITPHNTHESTSRSQPEHRATHSPPVAAGFHEDRFVFALVFKLSPDHCAQSAAPTPARADGFLHRDNTRILSMFCRDRTSDNRLGSPQGQRGNLLMNRAVSPVNSFADTLPREVQTHPAHAESERPCRRQTKTCRGWAGPVSASLRPVS